MPRSFRLIHNLRSYGYSHKPLWAVSLMVFFHALFDGITGYTVPFVLLDAGYNKTQMGLIYASSSGIGAIFDIILSKFLKNSNFRRLYLLMFVVSFAYPIFLYRGNTLLLFLVAMGLWGIYYDLLSFGNFDYVGRNTPHNEHSSAFGIMDVFKAAGLLVAPIIAGIYLASTSSINLTPLALIFLTLSFAFFVILVSLTRKSSKTPPVHVKARGLLEELVMWRKVGKIILPVLVCLSFLNIFDAFFWTVGPLLSEELSAIHPFGGLLLSLYFLPTFVMGWFIGNITAKYGKKRTAYCSLLVGSLLLVTTMAITNVFLLLLVIFLSSVASAAAWPAMRGAIADYISETPRAESEIQGVGDFSTNIGYIIGPALAGLLADYFGNKASISMLGVAGVFMALLLLYFSPRRISIPKTIA